MGDDIQDERRMTRMETRLDSLDQKVDKVDASVEGIHTKLDSWAELFVPRKEIDAKFDAVNQRLQTLEENKAVNQRLDALEENQKERRSTIPMWISCCVGLAACLCEILPHIWR